MNDEKYRGLIRVAEAALSALRSYEHGNSSTELASEIADRPGSRTPKAQGGISVKKSKPARAIVTFSPREADELTRFHTAFENFEALLAAPGYRPSLNVISSSATRLADLYDSVQANRGDHRRVMRYKRGVVVSSKGVEQIGLPFHGKQVRA